MKATKNSFCGTGFGTYGPALFLQSNIAVRVSWQAVRHLSIVNDLIPTVPIRWMTRSQWKYCRAPIDSHILNPDAALISIRSYFHCVRINCSTTVVRTFKRPTQCRSGLCFFIGVIPLILKLSFTAGLDSVQANRPPYAPTVGKVGLVFNSVVGL